MGNKQNIIEQEITKKIIYSKAETAATTSLSSNSRNIFLVN